MAPTALGVVLPAVQVACRPPVYASLDAGLVAPPDKEASSALAPVAPLPAGPVVRAVGRGSVPAEVRATAQERTTLLQLALRETQIAEDWRGHRALLEDLVKGETRAYAVGDLLPRGGILVGVDRDGVRIMAADALLLWLGFEGSAALVHDLRRDPPEVLPTFTSTLSAEARADLERAIYDLGSVDAATVAGAVEVLLAVGATIAELLADAVDRPELVALPVVEISGRPVLSETVGDRVVAVLEQITGQSFGDPVAGDRAAVIRDWRYWAGLEGGLGVDSEVEPGVDLEVEPGVE